MKDKDNSFDIRDKRRFHSEENTSKKKSFTKNKKDSEQLSSFEVNFLSYILGMSTSAFVALGDIENPVTREKETDLSVAKQIIDILGILEEKTRGNLTDEEEKAFKEVLYGLRMSYVQKAESTGENK